MPKQSKKTISKTKVKIEPKLETIPSNEENQKSVKRGAKSQYANKVLPYLEKIATYTRCGVTEGQLCEFYGVGKTQWAQYKKTYPELNETLYKAKQELKVNLINKSFDVAMGYTYEETTVVEYKDKDGNVKSVKTTTYTRHAKPDSGMLQFLLINRFSDEFARDPQMVELRKKALQLQKEGKMPLNFEGV